LPEITKVRGNLMKFWRKQCCTDFYGTQCRWKPVFTFAPSVCHHWWFQWIWWI